MKRKALFIALCALAIGTTFAQTTVITKKRLKTAPLQVLVNVRNADIYVDGGRISGDTAQVEYGTHVVKVMADGFIPSEQTVKVSGPLTIKVDLQAAFAKLGVIAKPREALILVDGARMQGNPMTVNLGTHTITVKANGYEDYEEVVQVTGSMTVTADLQPAFAKLGVIAKPKEALILVDGERMKVNPMVVNLGAHTVTVRANGYRDYEEIVQVNGPVTVEAVLQPNLFNVQVQVDVPGAMITFDDMRVQNGRIDLPGGRYRLKVVARGFGEYVDDVDVRGDMVIPVRMRRASATIIIVPPDAYVNKNAKGNHFGLMELWIDGKPVKLNRDRIEVAPGNHKLLFVTGGLWASADIDIESGETYTVEPELVLKVDFLRGRRDRDDRDRRDRDDRGRDDRDRRDR